MTSEDYRVNNHANWESRVPYHAAGDEYQIALVDRPERLAASYTLRARKH